MADSGCLTEGEMGLIFVNWKELIMSNTKLLKWVLVFSSRVFVCMCCVCNVCIHDSWMQSWTVISFLFRALRVRKKTGGEKMPVQMIGDILAAELSHMQAYIRFCSCQLNGASLLQQKTDEEADFKDYLKVSCSAAFDLRISSLTACLTSTDQIRITQRSKSWKIRRESSKEWRFICIFSKYFTLLPILSLITLALWLTLGSYRESVCTFPKSMWSKGGGVCEV